MKRTKNQIMNELSEAIQERDYLEYVKIDKLKQELRKFKLSKSDKQNYEIYD